jgi:hypothetical protein
MDGGSGVTWLFLRPKSCHHCQAGGEDERIPAALLQMPIERLGLQFRSIASAFFRVCGTSRCSMTSFCRKYSSGSSHN